MSAYTNSYGGNYTTPQAHWQNVDPQYQNQFLKHKITNTSGGSQVVESQQPMKTGIMGKLGNLAHRGQEVLGMTGNANSRWALFGVNEPLLGEYTAKTAYGEKSKLGGWIYLSEHNFGWISHTDSMNRVVKTLIPYSNISNIVPTNRVAGLTKGTYRFNAINTPGVRADGFQIFTKDGLVYQFFALKNVDLVFNLLHTQWQNKYATGFQSGLQQGGFTGNYASNQAAYGSSTQGYPQQSAAYAQTQQTYVQPTGVAQQNVGKAQQQPFTTHYAVQQDPNYGTKGVHGYAGGNLHTHTNTQQGIYQPSTAPTNLGQTAPGQQGTF